MTPTHVLLVGADNNCWETKKILTMNAVWTLTMQPKLILARDE